MESEIKVRLIKHVNFLQEELKDFEGFESLSWEEYNLSRDKRRNVERWVENIINSSINIAKIILASEGSTLPDTYREVVVSLSLVSVFDKNNMEDLSRWVKLRNIITHEYLDIRWKSIRRFIKEAEPMYNSFLETFNLYLKENCDLNQDTS